MSKIYFLFIIFVCFNFGAKAQNESSVNFLKKSYNFKLDTPIEVSVFFKNNFYCLRSDHQVFIINGNKNEIDYGYKDNSRTIELRNLYVVNDTLIGLNKSDTYYFNGQNKIWTFLKKGIYLPPVYEDNDYIVTATCRGEWGGSLYFKNKKTNKLYECICTCETNVIKTQNKFIVTASLSHMGGFTNIFEIANPLKLKLFKPSDLNRKKIKYVGDAESNSRQGTQPLIDSIGIICAASFEYNGQHFYIVEHDKDVSIDIVQNKKLIPVDRLNYLNIWSYYPETRLCNGISIFSFTNDQNTGFVSIVNNSMTIYSFKLNHT